MSFSQTAYDLPGALQHWLLVCLFLGGVALVIGLLIAFAVAGFRGPQLWVTYLLGGFRDLLTMSPRRVFSLANLTVKEAISRKALLVFVVFLLLFMFAGWFLSGEDEKKFEPIQIKQSIAFVMTVVNWLILPVVIFLACWGIPEDIRLRSLHTVVTKPARRCEVVLGRMLGCIALMTLVVAVMGTIGYFWVLRQVPAKYHSELICRSPLYGEMKFFDRTGTEKDTSDPRNRLSVGDLWNYRTFVEGNTRSYAQWTFQNIETENLEKLDSLPIEYRFELFRTHKGTVGTSIFCELTLVNPEKKLRVPLPVFQVHEFPKSVNEATFSIPKRIIFDPAASGGDAKDAGPRTVDLWKDLVSDQTLIVEARCVDAEQYMGVAAADLFIRNPDRSFLTGYSKAIFSIWLMCSLISILGTSVSTFVKGPIATILMTTFLVVGQHLREYMQEQLGEFTKEGTTLGGGAFESLYRLLTQRAQMDTLPDGYAKTILQTADEGIYRFLGVVQNIIPNFKYFQTAKYVENGFDVPWGTAEIGLLPAVAVTVGFLIPCLIIGYYSLQLRELESK